MNTYALCPCCSGRLIHQISHHRDYWFCRTCWEEMPILEIQVAKIDRLKYQHQIDRNSLANLIKPKKALSGIS